VQTLESLHTVRTISNRGPGTPGSVDFFVAYYDGDNKDHGADDNDDND